MGLFGTTTTVIAAILLQSPALLLASLAVGALLGLVAHERHDVASPGQRAFWRRCSLVGLILSVVNVVILLGFAFHMSFRAGRIVVYKSSVRPLENVLRMLDAESTTGDADRARDALSRAAEGLERGEPSMDIEREVYDLVGREEHPSTRMEADAATPSEGEGREE